MIFAPKEMLEVEARFLLDDEKMNEIAAGLTRNGFEMRPHPPELEVNVLLACKGMRSIYPPFTTYRLRWKGAPVLDLRRGEYARLGSLVFATKKQLPPYENLKTHTGIRSRLEKEFSRFYRDVKPLTILELLSFLGYHEYFRYEGLKTETWKQLSHGGNLSDKPSRITVNFRKLPYLGWVFEIEATGIKLDNSKANDIEIKSLMLEVEALIEKLGLSLEDSTIKDVEELYRDFRKKKGIEFSEQLIFDRLEEAL